MNEKLKKHTVMFRQLHPDSTQSKIDKERIRVANRAYSYQLFARTYARHVWDIKVMGVVMLGTQHTGINTFAKDDVIRFMQETGTGDFSRNYTHIIGGTNGGVCGEAILNGRQSVTFGDNQACDFKTDLHEGFGHNNGLHHASTLNESTGRRSEYGGIDSIMGNGQVVSGLNSAEMVKLGLVPDREIVEVTENTQVLLRPIELHSDALHQSEHKHAIVHIGRRRFHVSIRKAKGWRYMIYNNGPEMLYIHEALPDGHSVNYVPNMRYARDSVTIKDAGFTVEYLSYDDERAVVNIIVDDSKPRPAELPVPTGFPPVLGVLQPHHTGGWYNPEYNGQGFEVHVKGNQALIFWYTYNQQSKSRRFYYATGSVDDLCAGLTLYTTDKGTWTNPKQHELIPVGKIQFSIDDDQTALVRWNTREHGNGACRLIQNMVTNKHELTGAYIQKGREGEGFNLHFFGNRVIMFWFTYGPLDRSNMHNLVDITTVQRWYTGEGELNDAGDYDIKLYEVTDHYWMMLDDDSGTEFAGSAKLTPKNMRLTFDLNTDTLKGRGDYRLSRIF